MEYKPASYAKNKMNTATTIVLATWFTLIIMVGWMILHKAYTEYRDGKKLRLARNEENTKNKR